MGVSNLQDDEHVDDNDDDDDISMRALEAHIFKSDEDEQTNR